MRNLVSEYATQFRQDRQKQIRLVAILAALAVVVAVVVFWQLHNTGVAMSNEVFCGQEEHVHDENCYAEVLTCNLDESDAEGGHIHSDECYETVLTCEIPEHTHTIECMTDESADVETAGDWEATLPEELSGVWSDDVVAVAESQLGYTESTANFQLGEDGETRQGYTRYGAWYGNEYGDWDAMFAAFCLNYAGISEEEMPYNSGAYAWTAALSDSDLYVESGKFTPNEGDLIFFDTDVDGKADGVGIVSAIDEDTGVLTVIEGNSGDAVAESTYDADSEIIIGYGLLPEQTAAEDGEVTAAAGAETAETEDAKIETDEKATETATVLTYEGTDYTVTVSYDSEAGLPDNTELVVNEYLKDTPGYLARFSEAADLYGLADSDTNGMRLFSISLYSDGEEVEPEAKVQVTISYLNQNKADEDEIDYSVIHFGDAGTGAIDPVNKYENGEQDITFTVSAFSDFMVIDNGIVAFSASVPADPNYFDFKIPNLDMSKIEDGKIYDQDDIFYIIPDGTKPVDYGTAQLEMDKYNMEIVSYGNDLLTTEEFPNEGTTLILLDLEKANLTSSTKMKETVSPGGIYDTKFDDAVSGEGTILEDVGQIKFTDASTVDGKGVDVIVTLDSVRLYNSFANEFIMTSSRQVALRDNKLTIANASGSKFWIAMNYVSGSSDPYGYFVAHDKYSSYYYNYTCLQDVDVTINVVWSDTGETVDKEFLQVASDIDVYHNDPTDPDDYRVYGYFAETFKTLQGFSGTYYIYNTDIDNIWADPAHPLGVVWIQANGSGDVSGDDSYTKTGIYADTVTGEWQVGYSDGWCGTAIEVYNYTTNDITVKKVDDSGDPLEGVGFILSRQLDVEDENGKPTGDLYEVEYYTGTALDSYGGTISTWSTDITKAKTITTALNADGDAVAVFEAIEPCDHYYLTEVSAPDGYLLLDHTILFTVETYGIITCSDPSVTLDVGGSLNMTVSNTEGAVLPNTGGIGTTAFTITGVVLAGGAVSLLIYRKRRAVRS